MPQAGGVGSRAAGIRLTCSYQEWESLRGRFEEAVDGGQLREFLADAAARIEAFVDDPEGQACAPEDADRVRGRGRRRRTEWVA